MAITTVRTASPHATGANVAECLQRILFAMVDMSSQARHAHWNVVGQGIRPLHRQLDELAEVLVQHTDTLAQRMRARQEMPDGRAQTVAMRSELRLFPAGLVEVRSGAWLICARLVQVVELVQDVRAVLDGVDSTASEILDALLEDLETRTWKLSANHELD
ncbi:MULTISPECIES: Dps family protein [Micrococcales]|uniref:Starvation-inducible DNA-binding protein n=2 Tax=Micrococcales TaxID=85006 RepID=A0A3D9LBC5_9MICC|nr:MULTISPECIES: ferritin-like domain-containing protein [Micrococcales]MDN4464625.1 DNA starvation/stationary phase protection protein [Microbacterium aurantiacum]REE03671.1 starvation-inducible DNA-binding protein [Citricoccus muralis]